jgi:hypothetical protein
MISLPAFPWFNPLPRVSRVPLPQGDCIVIDEVLRDPEAWVRWAAEQAFAPPSGYPYPGLVLPAPAALGERLTDCFAQHARSLLGARRTLDATVRFSLLTTAPQDLEPLQWQCHRDRISTDPTLLFAASVLYLFCDPALGGTSFYVPRRSPAETDRLVADSMQLGREAFAARWGVTPGYMSGTNDHFERIARVPAAFNRMIVYDGSVFHSADVDSPQALSAQAQHGRLTLNAFFTCRRASR